MKIKPYRHDNSPLGYSVGITLDRFIKSKQADFPFATGELSQLLRDMLSYLMHCKEKNYSARYIGSLVADFHRNLLKGGIYLYPGTKKAIHGKIRLVYEANALAFIAEQAGGRASDGKNRI